ncbi:unnamed protein product, partial [marine sediment metagenome]
DAEGLAFLPSFIITGVAMAFLSFFGYKHKYYLIIAFAAIFFISRLLVVSAI